MKIDHSEPGIIVGLGDVYTNNGDIKGYWFTRLYHKKNGVAYYCWRTGKWQGRDMHPLTYEMYNKFTERDSRYNTSEYNRAMEI